MAESAFGVDHGEVSKAINLPGFAKMPALKAAGSQFKAGLQHGPQVMKNPGAMKPYKPFAAGAKVRTGANAAMANKKPLAAGAGAGAVGGYGMNRKKKPGQV
jgi:hypothetical protein